MVIVSYSRPTSWAIVDKQMVLTKDVISLNAQHESLCVQQRLGEGGKDTLNRFLHFPFPHFPTGLNSERCPTKYSNVKSELS